jgi:hypothetical protein
MKNEGEDTGIVTPWPGVRVLARYDGEIDPYAAANGPLFRGEEAFAPEVAGWKRWSKPSPEPPLDESFRTLVLDAIAQRAGTIHALVNTLAEAIQGSSLSPPSPPLLVAILRAGLPVSVLLAHRLGQQLGAPVPVVALSLFAGWGWDEAALLAALHTCPNRPVWFVDGWTSRGGVANELRASYQRWLARGHPDFTRGQGPRLAVLCDPAGLAHAAGTSTDSFVPSSCFTAPETLGFSRGFVRDEPGMFLVYGYPPHLLQPSYLDAWMGVLDAPPLPSLPIAEAGPSAPLPPPQYRLHSNEVVRALINRSPREVLFRDDETTVRDLLAPVHYLCTLRGVPVRYRCTEVGRWGALVAARMGANVVV